MFLAVVSAVLFTVSCSDTKSYTDMLNDEKDAISKLLDTLTIDGQRATVLRDFPTDSIFQPHEFYKLENGVYLNIIEKGGEERAIERQTSVISRFAVKGLIKDLATFNSIDNSLPVPGVNFTSFVYGNYYSFKQGSLEYFFIGEGVNNALKYVGDYGRVKLIVPFKRGSLADQSNGEPRYFMDLKFQFE